MAPASHPSSAAGAGPLLRDWRHRRRYSQMELAGLADVSTRHLSYVETGKSQPSRELLLHLARALDVPLREQNQFLLAAGYAPAYSEMDLDDPEMRPVADALSVMLAAADPHPALVMDRRWNLLLANDPAFAWTASVSPALLDPPMNVARLTLHPAGLAGSIVNFDEVAEHVLARLTRQVALTGDPELAALCDEVIDYVPAATVARGRNAEVPVVVPVRMRIDGVERSYVSVVATFGAAVDVTASELMIETFYGTEPHGTVPAP